MATRKWLSIWLAWGLCAALSAQAGAAAPAAAAPTSGHADEDFLALADRYFDGFYFPTQPSIATASGIHRYDGQLEDFSRQSIDARIDSLKQWEQRVASFDPAPLGEQVRGDRELVLANIRGNLLTWQTIKPWQNNPDSYSSGIASSAFGLMSRRFAAPEQRLRSLIAREQQMPEALAAARQNLLDPPRIYTEIALEQLPGLLDFFRKDVPAAFAEVKDPRLLKQFAVVNAQVIQALTEYQLWLRSNLLPRSNGDFRLGEQTYRRKLAYDEMVDTPLQQLLALDMRDLQANQREFAAVAKQLDPAKTPRQVLAELAADHPDPAQLLPTFRASFDALIDFIQRKRIISLPAPSRPIVEETPPFMRATTFASMDTPGPFETRANEAYFNVTLPEPNWDAQRVAEFMAQFNYAVINNVAVHEAYPGHYVQFMWMQRIHDRVRQLLGASSNAEGWAHYSEQMMLEQGLAQAMYPHDLRKQRLLKLGQLQDALLRNARFVVGIKLHTGQMSFDQAVDFFVEQGYQSRAVGLIETKRGTADPTYLYYTLGKLQILKLRQDVQQREGKGFDLERFHDDFMRQGFAPIRIVRRAMLHDDSPTL